MIAEGERAPDFTLPDQDGRQVTLALSRARGTGQCERVGLLLHPSTYGRTNDDTEMRRGRRRPDDANSTDTNRALSAAGTAADRHGVD